MSEIFAIAVTAAIADNVLFAKMLGLCPFVGLSKHLATAAGIGAATTAVLTAACAAAWLLQTALPASWSAAGAAGAALLPLVFIAVVACLVQAAEMFLRAAAPLLHRQLGVFLPLIATNCAVLGVMLLAVRGGGSFAEVVAAGFGGGVGFLAAAVSLALLRARTVEAEVPAPFRGAPLSLLTAGFLALVFSNLAAN